MTALLEVKNLSQTFGSLRAVDNANFSVREGELVGLIGPNGAGKSTLYNLIAGAIKPTAGQIYFNGKGGDGLETLPGCKGGPCADVSDSKAVSQFKRHR